MIQELRELLGVVEKLPAMTLWVLGGFAVYKLVVYLSTTGAVVMLVRLAIEKLHDYKVRPPQPDPPKAVSLERIFITSDGTYERFRSILELVRDGVNLQKKWAPGGYLHNYHVDFIIKSLEEKIERDGLPKMKPLSEFLREAKERT